MPDENRRPPHPLQGPVGLVLVGYGLLVLSGVLAHDATWAGIAALLLGALLVARGLPRLPALRETVTAALGSTAVFGLVAYNALRASDLSTPEWAILAYGTILNAAAPILPKRIGRTTVSTFVAWSFPLLLAPLSLYALNGAITTTTTTPAATGLVEALVVAPTAWTLNLLGTDVTRHATNLVLPTDRGLLVLGVGLVCAGLYPAVLFAGLAGLHAWNHPGQRTRLAALLALGLVGLWVLNILRLVLLAKIGQEWGASALQTAHANLGWILFIAYMAGFWWLVFRLAPVEPQDEDVGSSPAGPEATGRQSVTDAT